MRMTAITRKNNIIVNVNQNIEKFNKYLEEPLWTTISVCNEDGGTCSIPSVGGDNVYK